MWSRASRRLPSGFLHGLRELARILEEGCARTVRNHPRQFAKSASTLRAGRPSRSHAALEPDTVPSRLGCEPARRRRRRTLVREAAREIHHTHRAEARMASVRDARPAGCPRVFYTDCANWRGFSKRVVRSPSGIIRVNSRNPRQPSERAGEKGGSTLIMWSRASRRLPLGRVRAGETRAFVLR